MIEYDFHITYFIVISAGHRSRHVHFQKCVTQELKCLYQFYTKYPIPYLLIPKPELKVIFSISNPTGQNQPQVKLSVFTILGWYNLFLPSHLFVGVKTTLPLSISAGLCNSLYLQYAQEQQVWT